jgi:hypothetical protein
LNQFESIYSEVDNEEKQGGEKKLSAISGQLCEKSKRQTSNLQLQTQGSSFSFANS